MPCPVPLSGVTCLPALAWLLSCPCVELLGRILGIFSCSLSCVFLGQRLNLPSCKSANVSVFIVCFQRICLLFKHKSPGTVSHGYEKALRSHEHLDEQYSLFPEIYGLSLCEDEGGRNWVSCLQIDSGRTGFVWKSRRTLLMLCMPFYVMTSVFQVAIFKGTWFHLAKWGAEVCNKQVNP